MVAQTDNAALDTMPCAKLKGIGPKTAERLEKCGISTIQDLLFHLPYRYQDRTRLSPMGSLRQGDYAVVEGEVVSVEIAKGRKPSLLCQLSDGTGFLKLRFFHFNASQKQGFKVGSRWRCFAEVRGWFNHLEMIHPEYRRVGENSVMPVEEVLTPIYPTTAGLQQRSLRLLTDQALALLKQGHLLQEYLPDNLRQQFVLADLSQVLDYVHRPPPDAQLTLLANGKHPAQQRLAFEELLAHHLCLRRLRLQAQRYNAPCLQQGEELISAFLKTLPFTLTVAQQRVVAEVQHEVKQTQPMMQLVQGDVGSGKTIVALLAALQAVASGYQVALMAPTEILAEQHYMNFCQWLAEFDISITWLAGKLGAKQRRENIALIATGEAQIVIGTHALFQKEVNFYKLGLVIIDEQHRFGVHQRLALREKGAVDNFAPHQLIMTATPIPRTLAMTVYADLAVSIIDELPPGRTPVKTVAISNNRRDEIVERIATACQQQKQVYWVCTLIEESELLQCQAAEETAAQLTAALPQIKIALVHGRLKSQEKQQIMSAFKQGEIDLLVATTVIEVGVDVPNASLMIIENPERLGLSQLHQLRGRVGRGSTESFCVLLYRAPLSEQSRKRLQVMRSTNDGFVIAQEDLNLRGPGEVLGTKQTGMINMRIADLLRDQALITKVQQVAEVVLQNHSEIIDPLIRRWLPQGQEYAKV